MADRRIRYAKDKADIIKRLVAGEDSNGPFKLIADVLVFAAAVGVSSDKRQPLGEDLAEPIRQEVFDRQGYDTVMNLIAVYAEQTPAILSETEESAEQRARIFEEYANAGLGAIQDELRGAADSLESVLLMVTTRRKGQAPDEGGMFDLSKLVG
jgi:dnd system-associated protein 4